MRAETYIASGNVVLDSRAAPMRVKAALEAARLHEHFGKVAGVIVRTAAEMVVAANPLPKADWSKTAVLFLDARSPRDALNPGGRTTGRRDGSERSRDFRPTTRPAWDTRGCAFRPPGPRPRATCGPRPSWPSWPRWRRPGEAADLITAHTTKNPGPAARGPSFVGAGGSPQNLKLNPPRTRLARKPTLSGAVEPQLRPQSKRPRSVRRYSTLALRFRLMPYSRPAPAAQPAWVLS